MGYQQQQGRDQRGNPILQGGNMGNNQMYQSSNQAYGQNRIPNNNNPRGNMQMQGQQEYQNNRGQRQQIPVNDLKGRSNVTFPSFQRVEDNKDEIQRIDYELARLTQHRKIVIFF